MTYFVTGATGFIGRHLLERLLQRKGTIHCLVRTGTTGNFEWHDNLQGGEDTAFLTALGRVVAAKR